MGLINSILIIIIINSLGCLAKTHQTNLYGRSLFPSYQPIGQRKFGYVYQNHGTSNSKQSNLKNFEYKAVPRQGFSNYKSYAKTAISEREHILQLDSQEVRLYLLRTDQQHKDGPEDFIRFSSSNKDIISCLQSNIIVLVHGFSPFEDKPKYGYDVFAEQKLLRTAYANYEENRSVFLLDWSTYTTRNSNEYQLAIDMAEDAANTAKDLFLDVGLFDEDNVKCIGFEYLGKKFCNIFIQALKLEAENLQNEIDSL